MSIADVTQWSIYELSFRANGNHHWSDFPLQVTFENAVQAGLKPIQIER